jgi:hypothetical protein
MSLIEYLELLHFVARSTLYIGGKRDNEDHGQTRYEVGADGGAAPLSELRAQLLGLQQGRAELADGTDDGELPALELEFDLEPEFDLSD